jgi:hypothetical protein
MVSKEQIDRLVDAIEGVADQSIGNTDIPENVDLMLSWIVEISKTLERIAVALEKK